MADTILVPIDLNQEAVLDSVFQAARDYASAHNCSIHLLTVVPDLDTGLFPYVDKQFIAKTVTEAGERLEKIAQERLGDEFNWKTQSLAGPVARTIIRIADENEVKMIVMASHNPVFSDIFFGSIASQVVKHSRRSVMIVRQATGDTPKA